MDALIMAAGRGSRLGTATDEKPKALVDLGGVSPLELQLDLLASRGIRRATIVTGYRAEAVQDVARRRAQGRIEVEFTWNPFWPITNVAGSAWFARDHMRGAFVYLHADTVFHPSILDDLLSSSGDACLPIDFRVCEPEQMKAQVIDGRIRHLSKELPDTESNGEFIGIGVLGSAAVPMVRDALDGIMQEGQFTAYFEAALNVAIEAGLDVQALPVRGRAWAEIDFPEDLDYARSILSQVWVRPPDAAALRGT